MSSFPIIDLIAGMIFVYFMLSIISSSIVEVFLTLFKIRGKILGKWLLTIFDKKMVQPDGKIIKLGQAIMDHCLTTALTKEGKATSFMDAKNFFSALTEKLTFHPENPDKVITNLDDLVKAIKDTKAVDGSQMLSTELQRTLLIFANEAKMLAQSHGKTDFQLFREKVENWFDSTMDRIGGKMKKKYARPLTFWVGVLVVIGLNADTIAISKYLYSNPDARAKAAAAAYNAPQDSALMRQMQQLHADTLLPDSTRIAQKELIQNIKERAIDIRKDAAQLGDLIPLGWGKEQKTYYEGHKFSTIMGWLATIMAIMLGAPFWFDLLNKVANIRGSGNKPPSSTDKQRNDAKTDK